MQGPGTACQNCSAVDRAELRLQVSCILVTGANSVAILPRPLCRNRAFSHQAAPTTLVTTFSTRGVVLPLL